MLQRHGLPSFLGNHGVDSQSVAVGLKSDLQFRTENLTLGGIIFRDLLKRLLGCDGIGFKILAGVVMTVVKTQYHALQDLIIHIYRHANSRLIDDMG